MSLRYLSCEVRYEGESYSRAPCENKAMISKDEKTISALVPRRYVSKNGLVFLSQLMIISDSHESIFYSANSATERMKRSFDDEGGLESILLNITDGLSDEGKVPVLTSLSSLEAKSPESPKFYYEASVEGGNPTSISIDFTLEGTNKVFSSYSEDFFKVSPNTWRFAIPKKSFIYKGNYRLNLIRISEAFAHNFEVDVPVDAAFIGQTQIPVPFLNVTKGFAMDAVPARLASVKTEVDGGALGMVRTTLQFEGEIPVSRVYAIFENTMIGVHSEMWLDGSFFGEPSFTQVISAGIGFDTLNGTYRLKTLEVEDVGQNKIRVELKSDDLVIPGTQIAVPSYEITTGKDFDGPNIVSLVLDKTNYKKGETLNLIAKTKPGKGIHNAWIDFQGAAADSNEISTEFTLAGEETTTLSVLLDERFPPGEYFIQSFQAMGEGRKDVNLWRLGTNSDTYFLSTLKVFHFTVE